MQTANQNPRVAWLLPSMGLNGGLRYWGPVLRCFAERFPKTTFFTGAVPAGFDAGNLKVELIPGHGAIALGRSGTGYQPSLTYANPRVLPAVVRYKPDVIVTTEYGSMTLYGILAKGLLRCPKLVMLTEACPQFQGLPEHYRHGFRRFLVKRIDRIVPNIPAVSTYLQETLKVSRDRIAEGPFYVPDHREMMKATAPSSGLPASVEPRFLYVGQFIQRKGLYVLLDAVRRLKEAVGPRFSVWLVGDGAERDALMAQAQADGIGDVLRWLGPVPYTALGHVFKASQVFILPSYRDTYGMVVPEAMSFGKPVLCTRSAGASNLVQDGVNGWVFDVESPESLANCMRTYIDLPWLVAEHGANSLKASALQTPAAAVSRLARAILE